MEPTLPNHRFHAVFAVTALATFVVSLDVSIVNVAFPALQRSFAGTPRASLAWIITAYSVMFGSLLVTGGRTADRLGRRRVFLLGAGLFMAASALCGVAPTVPLLIAGRVLQGIGGAFMLPASLGLLLVAIPLERRSQMVALWGAVSALGVATGPSLGALVVSTGGWRWAFYLNLPVLALALIWGRRVFPAESRPEGQIRPDYLGVAMLTGGLATLILAISEGPTWGWTDARVAIALTLAGIVGRLFIWRSLRHPEPVLDLNLFRSRSFSVANVATLVYAMGFTAMQLGNILFLTSVWHYSILSAGLAVTPGPLVVALVAGPAGRLANRFGFRAILVVGGLVFAAGLTCCATLITTHPDFLGRWLPIYGLTAIGIGLTFPVLGAASVSSLGATRYAVGGSVQQAARQIGGSLGIAVLVAILAAGQPGRLGPFTALWSFGAATGLATSMIVLALRGPVPLPALTSGPSTVIESVG